MAIGVWLVGARGNVATLSMVGARAVAREVAGTTGMVTARDPVASLDMPPVEEFAFAGRNLRVLSREGHNILGNTDGLVLEEEENGAGKIESEGRLLERILGYETHNGVRIDYTPSLGDWKTAWDHIHFEGFLGTETKKQFTWESSDSALAAPLLPDLVRLVAYADEHCEGGIQPPLASFFKSTMGVDEHDLSGQLELFYDYAERHAEGR
ncbi:hypothetical protein BRC93_15425 [Halobacteriales archaeon QS_5_70_15]|nr:MAG: hypothetical protein BRC93_15425 [Halobacteriales archaeon QS_5_70_15]